MSSRLAKFAVEKLSRRQKQLVMTSADLLVLPAWLFAAVSIRLGSVSWPDVSSLGWLAMTSLVMLTTCWKLGLYRSLVRYQSGELWYHSVEAVGLASLILMACNQILLMLPPQALGLAPLPWNSFLIFWGGAVIWVQGSRLLVRDWLRRQAEADQERVLIWGAGVTGCQLARMLQDGSDMRPLAYLDDSAELVGAEAHGLRVHAGHELEALVSRQRVAKVIVAVRNAGPTVLAELLQRLESLPVRVLIAPDITEMLRGDGQLAPLREVTVDDLLAREPVTPDEQILHSAVAGRSVLVTGAGGSIGSELCRQILKRKPACLVLFERNEFALYSIERELQADCGETQLVPVLGSVLDYEQMLMVMTANHIDLVYHAAAYKHVPLVEANPLQGIANNVNGTRQTARAAKNSNVRDFILISTDKAVRPTNVMGASKRAAEQLLQLLAAGHSKTRFSMVRFGNVLGSSGSVVPLFREQIASGGPVTVTHRDIIRYFMTIPEAAQLVMQAGGMAKGGEVFLLDMGAPVNIADMAARMIRLSGASVRSADNPKGDIAIEYTGLRPGEKLYEELLIGAADEATEHPRIRCAQEGHLPAASFGRLLEKMLAAVRAGDEALAMHCLRGLVPDYRPAANGQSVPVPPVAPIQTLRLVG